MKPIYESRTNLVLIGMPGAGKSTLGVLLAKALGKDFVDTDLMIQSIEGRLLQEIIATEGVAKFLSIEESVLLSLNAADTVIATGGSAIYSNHGMTHLKEEGVIIYIELTYETIAKRIANIASRGIAMGKEQQLIDVYQERVPIYRKYADLIIDCEERSIEESVDMIVNVYLG